MQTILELITRVDLALILEAVGFCALAFGLPAGHRFLEAGRTARELREVLDKAPISNNRVEKLAHKLGLDRAEKAIREIQGKNESAKPKRS